MTTLGIVTALPQEARCIVKRQLPAGKVIRITEHILLCLSGTGAKRAAQAGRQLLDQGAAALLSVGTAVALDPRLVTGTVLLPQRIVNHDQAAITVDAPWRAALQQRLADSFQSHTGPLADSPRILTGPAAKQALRQHTHAVAADMESAALGRLAAQHGQPFVALRVILDTAAMSLPAWLPGTLTPLGQPAAGAFANQLFRHPADWLSLVALGCCWRRARTRLQAVIAHIGLQHLPPVSDGRSTPAPDRSQSTSRCSPEY